MSAYNFFMFIITTVLWGATWIAIHFQVQNVSTYWSVAYRFAIAGILLLLYSILARQRLNYDLKQHSFFALQGSLIFSLNFILVYLGTQYLVSGLVALIFSLILLMNMVNSRIFFRTSLSWTFISGALCSLLGLFVIFSKDIYAYFQYNSASTQQELLGIALCVLGTLCASFGNMLVIQIKKMNVPLVPSTGYSMLYGALCSMLTALILGEKMAFDSSTEYLLSLAYLSIGGSIFGFLCYMKLIRNLGASQAAFVFIFTPVTAMILSTFFEELDWHMGTYIGLALISFSQIFILVPQHTWQKLRNFIPKCLSRNALRQ